jgi:hypothetical protein
MEYNNIFKLTVDIILMAQEENIQEKPNELENKIESENYEPRSDNANAGLGALALSLLSGGSLFGGIGALIQAVRYTSAGGGNNEPFAYAFGGALTVAGAVGCYMVYQLLKESSSKKI